jgi:DIS3-like exonuclease 2
VSAPRHQQQQGRGQRTSGDSGGSGGSYGTPPHARFDSGGGGSMGSGSARKPGRRGQYYQEHLPSHLLQQGLKSGGIFRAVFRTNPSDRNQGYCSLAGLPTDVFVRVRTTRGLLCPLLPNCWLDRGPACC